MNTKLCLRIASVALVALVATSAAAATPSAVGRWKINPSLSKFGAGPLPDTLVLQVTEASEERLTFRLTWTNRAGAEIVETYDGLLNGELHPVLLGEKEIARASYKWDSPSVLSGRAEQPDGTIETYAITIVPDGRSVIQQRHMKTPTMEYDDTIVFERLD